ncbi:hypothetical protein GJ699_31195 [Duganella sp. FT80W]|uniref:LppX_LprAFG lipoprotein n=1 Tax=Duganella guangzhouensis TaxID=2666084 RepID=A0A6I2LCF8_9BURK|nr:hypothetical protein [Duganella guangzhouensis]MRW94446.1 hypothetical protein [Duganella guangzhouensis]
MDRASLRYALLAVALLLTACQSIPQTEGSPATVAEVVGKIKTDLSVYRDYDARVGHVAALANTCNGIVGFEISSVKVALTTQTEQSSSTSAGATVPIGVSTFNGNTGSTRGWKGTQNLTFMLYPQPAVPTPVPNAADIAIDPQVYPIAASLQRLRDGLLEASDSKPCVALRPPPDEKGNVVDPGGTFVFGFTVVKGQTAGAGLKFLLFSVGGAQSAETQSGNTITIVYKARPGSIAINTAGLQK